MNARYNKRMGRIRVAESKTTGLYKWEEVAAGSIFWLYPFFFNRHLNKKGGFLSCRDNPVNQSAGPDSSVWAH
jgi:hypothetical protein